jgi:drug/metabolite transporter (DMT)-like permease
VQCTLRGRKAGQAAAPTRPRTVAGAGAIIGLKRFIWRLKHTEGLVCVRLDVVFGAYRKRMDTVQRRRAFGLIALVIALNNLGNLALACGMKRLPAIAGANPLPFVRAMLNPFVAIGIALLISWLLTRMILMSWTDLSVVVPLTAVGYISGSALAVVFLGESLTESQLVGTLLIASGAALVGSGFGKAKAKERAAKTAPR